MNPYIPTHRFFRRSFFLTQLLILAMLIVKSAAAAQLQVAISQSPYYVNTAVELEIRAHGFERSPEPSIEVPEPNFGKLKLTGVSPNISTSIQVINGQMSRSETVVYVYHYQFIANKPGAVVLGPFKVSQEGVHVETRTVPITITSIPVSGKQRVILHLPETLYIGQQMSLSFEWWVEPDLLEKLIKQKAHVPFFSEDPSFKFIDDDQKKSQHRLIIETPSGLAEFPASTSKQFFEGRQYSVYTVKRDFIPLKTGHFTIEPANMMTDEAIRWQRDVFGSQRPTQSRKLSAMDKQRVLEVKPIPQENRPDSFAGAVGNGFSIKVATNRSVVQVGEPITLSIDITGGATVAHVTLPSLSASGLAKDQFRLPDNEVAGVLKENTKHFEVTVRVTDEQVKDIPPLAFSWFDPSSESFQTAYSQPIALSVAKAQMVSANDVVTSKPSTETKQTQKSEANDAKMSSQKRVQTLELSGADLAIETNKDRLLTPQNSLLSSQSIQLFCYLLSLAILVLAIFLRRQSAVSPEQLKQQKQLQHYYKSIQKARKPNDLASALRQLVAKTDKECVNNELRSHFDAILSECDNLAFAPGKAGEAINEQLKQKALKLAEQLLEVRQ